MAHKRALSNSRRRPKRQRVQTTLYSDDNPNTFTTKEKKKIGDDSSTEDRVDESPPPRQQRRNEHAAKPGRKPHAKRGRKPKSYYEALAKKQAASKSSSTATQENDDNSTEQLYRRPYIRRKRRRPPETIIPDKITAPVEKKKPEVVMKTSDADTPKKTPPPSPLCDSTGTLLPHTVTVAPVVPPSSGQNEVRDKKTLELQFPTLYGKGLGLPVPMNEPQWSLMHNPDIYFDQDYTYDNCRDNDRSNVTDSDTYKSRRRPWRRNGRLDPSLLPVTRTVSCITTRRPDHQYMAVGDTAGFCVIYSLGPHIRAVARLESLACKQRALDQQQSVREQRSKRKKIRSLVVDTSQTTIHAMGMVGSRVVLATACELECMDIPSQTSLWVCPLSKERIVTSLDVHVSTYDVLVSCRLPSFYNNSDESKPNSSTQPSSSEGTASAYPSSPLMLLKHSVNNIEICDANSPILVKSPCCSAIWDSSRLAENRLLFVAPDENELELVLVQGGSIDNWKVACKTRIPVKSSCFHTKLCQSSEGIYTMVASSRGIRLYQTETLQLLQIYGDLLALHGRSIVWKDCLLLGNSASNTHLHGALGLQRGGSNAGKTIEYHDALNVQSKPLSQISQSSLPNPKKKGSDVSKSDKFNMDHSDLGQYIVGVPDHSKGPKELCETLHVWSVTQATTVPTLTIPLPNKSDGVQSLVVSASNTNLASDRLVLATKSGQCHEMLPKLQSDFAGIMYSPGYHVIQDNLEYIEDEDELDEVVSASSDDEEDENDFEGGRKRHRLKASEDGKIDRDGEGDDDSSVVDDDLKEAMRRSLLEQTHRQEDEVEEVVVVDVDDERDDDFSRAVILPCRPEAFLQQRVNPEENDQTEQQEQRNLQNSEQLSDTEASFVSEILGAIPNRSGLVEKRRKELLKRQANMGLKQSQHDVNIPGSTMSPSANIQTGAVTAKPGRGKRSRAANLDALLKGSINPKLQQIMISKQYQWVDGSGSTLEQPKEPKEASKIEAVSDKDNSDKEKEILENSAGAKSSINELPAISSSSNDYVSDPTTSADSNGKGNATNDETSNCDKDEEQKLSSSTSIKSVNTVDNLGSVDQAAAQVEAESKMQLPADPAAVEGTKNGLHRAEMTQAMDTSPSVTSAQCKEQNVVDPASMENSTSKSRDESITKTSHAEPDGEGAQAPSLNDPIMSPKQLKTEKVGSAELEKTASASPETKKLSNNDVEDAKPQPVSMKNGENMMVKLGAEGEAGNVNVCDPEDLQRAGKAKSTTVIAMESVDKLSSASAQDSDSKESLVQAPVSDIPSPSPRDKSNPVDSAEPPSVAISSKMESDGDSKVRELQAKTNDGAQPSSEADLLAKDALVDTGVVENSESRNCQDKSQVVVVESTERSDAMTSSVELNTKLDIGGTVTADLKSECTQPHSKVVVEKPVGKRTVECVVRTRLPDEDGNEHEFAPDSSADSCRITSPNVGSVNDTQTATVSIESANTANSPSEHGKSQDPSILTGIEDMVTEKKEELPNAPYGEGEVAESSNMEVTDDAGSTTEHLVVTKSGKNTENCLRSWKKEASEDCAKSLVDRGDKIYPNPVTEVAKPLVSNESHAVSPSDTGYGDSTDVIEVPSSALNCVKQPVIQAEGAAVSSSFETKLITESDARPSQVDSGPCDGISTEAASVTSSSLYSNKQSAALLESSLCSKLKADEAAVALGLLGLSPCNLIASQQDMIEKSPELTTSTGPLSAANESNVDMENHTSGDGILAASATDAEISDRDSEVACRSPLPPSEVSSCYAAYGTSESRNMSDRGSVNCDTSSELSVIIPSSQPTQKLQATSVEALGNLHSGIQCNACLGRMVVHACGKRALPIDFDEVARAERDRKEKEEEEKRKAKAEKRRLADAKRREARKQKQRERKEQKKLQEQKLKMEREEQKRQQEEKRKFEEERLRQLEMNNSFDTNSHVFEGSSQKAAYSGRSHGATNETPPTQTYTTDEHSQSTYVQPNQEPQIQTYAVDENRQSAYAPPIQEQPAQTYTVAEVSRSDYAQPAEEMRQQGYRVNEISQSNFVQPSQEPPVPSYTANGNSRAALIQPSQEHSVEDYAANANSRSSFVQTSQEPPVQSYAANENSRSSFVQPSPELPVQSYTANVNNQRSFVHHTQNPPLQAYTVSENNQSTYTQPTLQPPVQTYAVDTNGQSTYAQPSQEPHLQAYTVDKSRQSSYVQNSQEVTAQTYAVNENSISTYAQPSQEAPSHKSIPSQWNEGVQSNGTHGAPESLAYSSYSSHGCAVAASDSLYGSHDHSCTSAPDNSVSAISKRASSSTLASAEALAALAACAGAVEESSTLNHTSSATPSVTHNYEHQQQYYDQPPHSFANAATVRSEVSHGFSEGVPTMYGQKTTTYETKRRVIPSYAAIGAQARGEVAFNTYCGYEARAKSSLGNVIQSNGDQTYKSERGWETFPKREVPSTESRSRNYVDYSGRSELDGTALHRNMPRDVQDSSVPGYHGSTRPC